MAQASDSSSPHPLSLFGRDIRSADLETQSAWLEAAFQYWRQRGFPYLQLEPSEVDQQFGLLERLEPTSILEGDTLKISMVGLRLANAFHPQMWTVPTYSHRLAPVDHFHRNDTLTKLLERAARYWPDRRCWNAQCLRTMLRNYSGGRVANFRPTVAKAVISHLSKDGDRVLDFSAGYGGRLLGCASLHRHYVGIDPAVEQIQGLRQLHKALGSRCKATIELHEACAEDLLPHLEPASFDLVFSSPPYFQTERYSQDPMQSYLRYPQYEEWKQQFLRRVLQASKQLLKVGGLLAINVSNLRPHPLADDTRELAGSLFGPPSRVLRMLMTAKPVQRSNGHPDRWEPIFVFRKEA